jgi:hypothetical protein
MSQEVKNLISEEEKVTNLLASLSAFNQLNQRIVRQISISFSIDAEAICRRWGITYYLRDFAIPKS